MAGYSGTPLAAKLGVREGTRVCALGAPAQFPSWLDPLPGDVRWRSSLRGPLDLVVLFTTTRAELERRFPAIARALTPAGALWVAWPKRASGVATDLTENVLRDVLLPTGFVDTKVCAVSDVWSGLRFVLRNELRKS